jgi:hypothetical protein
MTMKQVPGDIEDALKLMITGSPQLTQTHLPVYLKQVQTASERCHEETTKVCK